MGAENVDSRAASWESTLRDGGYFRPGDAEDVESEGAAYTDVG